MADQERILARLAKIESDLRELNRKVNDILEGTVLIHQNVERILQQMG